MDVSTKSTAMKEKHPNRRLLLVNADPLLRWSIREYVGRQYEVVAADSKEDALEALKGSPFDAIVVSNGVSESGIRQLESTAMSRCPNVLRVRLTIGSPSDSRDPSVTLLEKPFTLSALGAALKMDDAAD